MCSIAKDIGIDLGTASVLVYVKGKGVVLNEPSVVAIDKNTGKLLKVGAEAQAMLGRTPGNIVAIRPLREGVISDYDMTERMLREFLRKVVGGFQLFKPRVIICVPSGITEVEERAVVDAGLQSGASHVYLIEEPVAAAIGAGIGEGDDEASFKLDRVRYHKIIIMTDADVDGAHIRTLLLTFFCRHMPQLVRAGYLYIAQAPLYRIIRRKKEEYVQDDVALNRKLIELAVNDVTLRFADGSRSFSPEELSAILETLVNLQRYTESMQAQGGSLEDLLSHREANGEFPEFLVKVRCGNEEEILFFHDMEALTAFSDENRDLFIFGMPSEEELLENPLPEREGPSRRSITHELHEAKAITRALARLAELGIPGNMIVSMDTPLFELVEGEGDKEKVTPLFSVMDILESVISIGKRGVEITRFKGLGEMDAKDLFKTTMDPERRELLRVILNDDNAVRADEMFTILMGDVVEPRKNYIVDHALNVRNLDI